MTCSSATFLFVCLFFLGGGEGVRKRQKELEVDGRSTRRTIRRQSKSLQVTSVSHGDVAQLMVTWRAGIWLICYNPITALLWQGCSPRISHCGGGYMNHFESSSLLQMILEYWE